MNSRPVTIIQARMTSSRLPGKVMKKIGNMSALELMLARLRRSSTLSRMVIAIPDTPGNDELAHFIASLDDVDLLRGPEDDVLTRFSMVAVRFPAPYYVRLTADCPFICPEIVDEVVTAAMTSSAWCCGNSNPPTFPDGFDVECVSASALDWLDRNATSKRHREHVTLRLYEDPPGEAMIKNIANPRGDHSAIRLTLDNPEDLVALCKLGESLGEGRVLTATEAEIEREYERLQLGRFNGSLVRNAAIRQDV